MSVGLQATLHIHQNFLMCAAIVQSFSVFKVFLFFLSNLDIKPFPIQH